MVGCITKIELFHGNYCIRRGFNFLYLSLNWMFLKSQKCSVHFHIHFLEFLFHLPWSFRTLPHESHHELQHRNDIFFDMRLKSTTRMPRGSLTVTSYHLKMPSKSRLNICFDRLHSFALFLPFPLFWVWTCQAKISPLRYLQLYS